MKHTEAIFGIGTAPPIGQIKPLLLFIKGELIRFAFFKCRWERWNSNKSNEKVDSVLGRVGGGIGVNNQRNVEENSVIQFADKSLKFSS